MYLKTCRHSGFTLIEVLIVLAISVFILSIILRTFLVFNDTQRFSREVSEVAILFKEAHSATLSSKFDDVYGIHIESTRVVLFKGGSFVESDAYNKEHLFGGDIQITTINLNGGGSDIFFKRLNGETLQYGTTTISSLSLGKSRNIVVHPTGVIEF